MDYDNKVVNKGNKIKFFEDENIFSNFHIFDDILNNIIRNSIGHYSYVYVADKQLIKFKDKNKNIDMYLIEFGELLLRTFFATFITLETDYISMKIFLLQSCL
ncbi:hypothetical protein CN380_21555 [Bacillus sp. AFS017274]|nr:hypothetical protein CN380_21555 [Bacillus sp. AFS017274]